MPYIVPIGGGKGGSGKSFLTGNLGLLLAKQGYRTLLFDADLGSANLHTMIGMPHTERSLFDFIAKRVTTLQEVVVETPIANLHLISGTGNPLDAANLAYAQKMKILRAITKLPYNYILLDLGAGTSFNIIDFFMISDSGIFITTPEPTSIENVYRLVRSVYARKIHQVLKSRNPKLSAEEGEGQMPSPNPNPSKNLPSIIPDLEPSKHQPVEEALRDLHFQLVLNQMRKQDNPNTGPLICKVIEKHLGFRVKFAGNISWDDRVHDAVCRRIPFLEKYPHTSAAEDLKQVCRNVLLHPEGDGGTGRAVERESFERGGLLAVR